MNDHQSGSARPHADDQRAVPAVRSRWIPKPEQILILETIFNSGMVNPPKDETIRIRKLLEKFGPVGDANVFYWFQNRRSRSRRRQRQIQATVDEADQPPCHDGNYTGFVPNSAVSYNPMNSGPSSSCGLEDNLSAHYNSGDFLSFSGQEGLPQQFEQNPVFSTNFSAYQSEMITVFINGVATEVGRGAVDVKGMFGGDLMIFHASGVPLELNENGILVQGLQHGESYFLVPRIC